MFFQKKIDKSMESIKNKNKNKQTDEIDFDEPYDPKAEWEEEQTPIDLDKKDILALMVSGLLVFSPIFIILILILIWATN